MRNVQNIAEQQLPLQHVGNEMKKKTTIPFTSYYIKGHIQKNTFNSSVNVQTCIGQSNITNI